MKTLFAVVTAAALLTTLTAGGCYKSDWEKEQTKSAELQKQLDTAQKELTATKALAAQSGQVVDQLLKGATLASFVDGKRVDDGIVLNQQMGVFVKHGLRIRGANQVSYTKGMLTDGPFNLKREAAPDKPYINGSVKGNKADGEWTWYDTAGKVTNKQVFADGKQVSVEAATVAKDGKVTWKKLDKTAADKFFDARKNVFVNIPEFSWSR